MQGQGDALDELRTPNAMVTMYGNSYFTYYADVYKRTPLVSVILEEERPPYGA